jgi:phage/plasmid primase-like uncharacterized protein
VEFKFRFNALSGNWVLEVKGKAFNAVYKAKTLDDLFAQAWKDHSKFAGELQSRKDTRRALAAIEVIAKDTGALYMELVVKHK